MVFARCSKTRLPILKIRHLSTLENNDLLKTDQYILSNLIENPKRWLVTGVAGFIGSNLLEQLLLFGQEVIGLDNFSTGKQRNLDDVRSIVGEEKWQRFRFFNGCLTDYDLCFKVTEGVDFVLHQGALGSVPRSIHDPVSSNRANVTGFLNILDAARKNNVSKFVFASSSSVYGDNPSLPKKESEVGAVLSPYALTKSINEQYADLYFRLFGLETVGLRYFNVFGPRQDPDGAYAAVIPRWVSAALNDHQLIINGDGEISRDFTYVDNVVLANILAACQEGEIDQRIFNIATGHRVKLTELSNLILEEVKKIKGGSASAIKYAPRRVGDILHSHADIDKARKALGYKPGVKINEGIILTIRWMQGKMVD